jgi:hypothetical protein
MPPSVWAERPALCRAKRTKMSGEATMQKGWGHERCLPCIDVSRYQAMVAKPID